MVGSEDTHSNAKSFTDLKRMLEQLLMKDRKSVRVVREKHDGRNEYMRPWNNYPCEMQNPEPFTNGYSWGSQPWQYPRQVQQGGFHGYVPYQQPQGAPPTFEANMKTLMQQYLKGQEKSLGELHARLDSMYYTLNTKIKAINTHMRQVDIQVAHNAVAVRRAKGREEWPVVQRRSNYEKLLELEALEEEEEKSSESQSTDCSFQSADCKAVDQATPSVGRHIVREAENPEIPQTTAPEYVHKLPPLCPKQPQCEVDAFSELGRLSYDEEFVVVKEDQENSQDMMAQSTDTAQQSVDTGPVDRHKIPVGRLEPPACPHTTSPQQQPLELIHMSLAHDIKPFKEYEMEFVAVFDPGDTIVPPEPKAKCEKAATPCSCHKWKAPNIILHPILKRIRCSLQFMAIWHMVIWHAVIWHSYALLADFGGSFVPPIPTSHPGADVATSIAAYLPHPEDTYAVYSNGPRPP